MYHPILPRLLFFFTCASVTHVAGAADVPVYQLPETVVTASRYAQPLATAPQVVTVLTRDDLAAIPARNLLETLSFTPGLAVQKSGGPFSRESWSIQGSEFRHVTLLLDGMPLNDLAEGMADPVQIPISQVDRVEIVAGPASAAWGSALAGVVQVLSSPLSSDQPTRVFVTSSYGTWATSEQGLTATGAAGRAGYQLTAGHATTDGFRPRSAHDGSQVLGRAEVPWREGRLGIRYGQLEGDTEDFVQYGQPVWKAHRYTTRYGQAYYHGLVHQQFQTQFQAYRLARTERVRFMGTEDGQELQTGRREEPAWGTSLELVGPLALPGRWSGGADLRWSSADFRYLGSTSTPTFSSQGAYLGWSGTSADLVASAGLRYDRHSLYGTQWSPTLGLAWKIPLASSVIRGQVARAFGAPPLSAAFLPETASTAPNPDLRAERATGYHLGLETHPSPYLWLRATWFRSDVRDAVDTAVNEDGKYVQRNFARQRRQGVQLESAVYLGRSLRATGGLVLNRVRSTDTAEVINGVARQTRDLGIEYRSLLRGTSLCLGGHYADYDIAPALKAPPTQFTARDGRFLWDARVQQRLPQYLGVQPWLFSAVRNLLNTEFWWLPPYPLPGRSFEAGLNLEWER